MLEAIYSASSIQDIHIMPIKSKRRKLNFYQRIFLKKHHKKSELPLFCEDQRSAVRGLVEEPGQPGVPNPMLEGYWLEVRVIVLSMSDVEGAEDVAILRGDCEMAERVLLRDSFDSLLEAVLLDIPQAPVIADELEKTKEE